MATDIPDLWPASFGESQVTPLAILREQAHLLAPKTDGVIYGEVKTIRWDSSSEGKERFRHTLFIRVPSLGDYRLELLTIQHDTLEYYPVQLLNRDGEPQFQYMTEDQFVDALRERLTSPSMVKMMNSLISQAQPLAS
jgi:hypothetical protein